MGSSGSGMMHSITPCVALRALAFADTFSVSSTLWPSNSGRTPVRDPVWFGLLWWRRHLRSSALSVNPLLPDSASRATA